MSLKGYAVLKARGGDYSTAHDQNTPMNQGGNSGGARSRDDGDKKYDPLTAPRLSESATRRAGGMEIDDGGVESGKQRVQSSSLVRGRDNNLDLKNNLTAIVPCDAGVTVNKD